MYKRILQLGVLVLISYNVTAADFSTPTSRVKDSIDKVIAILQNQSLGRDTKWKRIATVIREGFDFRSMSQSVLSTNWRTASPDEQERFTEFFSQYIEETYRDKIEAYTDEKVVYKNETIRGNRAIVETMIVTGSTEIPVVFKLREDDGQWYAYDAVIEGVSLVSNYRTTFMAIVRNEGMSGLLNNIQKRIDKYKERQEHKGAGGAAEKPAAHAAGEG